MKVFSSLKTFFEDALECKLISMEKCKTTRRCSDGHERVLCAVCVTVLKRVGASRLRERYPRRRTGGVLKKYMLMDERFVPK